MSAFSPIGTIYAKGIDGSPVIPSSQRPDGTWRKQRRVKEGYVPQDEVPLYESKGKQAAKNKPLYPVGMPPPTLSPTTNHNSGLNLPLTKRCPIPGLIIDEDYIKVMKSKSKKKAKSEAATGGNNVKKVTEKMAQFTIIEPPGPTKVKAKPATPSPSEPPKSTTNNTQQPTDPAKRLKNLKKKLREIESIEQKIKNGEIKHPEKDQLEKVSRKVEVTTEIEKLEKMST